MKTQVSIIENKDRETLHTFQPLEVEVTFYMFSGSRQHLIFPSALLHFCQYFFNEEKSEKQNV